jgi:hypothetical protein
LLDETIAFAAVEPLDRSDDSFGHCSSLLFGNENRFETLYCSIGMVKK